MNSFPLIRTKWSNEHLMSALFVVLILYLLPQWTQDPSKILSFIIVIFLGLIIDLIINAFRYKQLICGVSAAVTIAILEILVPGVPLLGKLLGISFALLAGKHIWGGTGKNPINPAITGLLFLSFIYNINIHMFTNSFILLPAIILSLPFIKFRPFAALAFIIGMVFALLLKQELSITSIVAYGVIFWGCIILTDPVTITVHPISGAILSFLGGLIPFWLFGSISAMAISVLTINIISFLIERFLNMSYNKGHISIKKKNIIPFSMDNIIVHNLANGRNAKPSSTQALSKDEILKFIKLNEVFGLGGAAFSTYEKIKTVIESSPLKKHLIINGVECDPGLIHDKWLLRRYPKEISKGIELLNKCISFDSMDLAVKDISGLNYPPHIKLFKVPNYYPIGAEKLLIKKLLNMKFSKDTIPAREGILVLNVQTIFSIYEAVCLNQRADTRFITVADMRNNSSRIANVRLGEKIFDIIDNIYPNFNNIFIGGGIMQVHVADEDAVVDKTVNFLGVSDFPYYKESPLCSKCGLCTLNCPSGLKVRRIAEFIDNGELDKARKLHPEDCINCGSCSYICPAGKNLAARIKTGVTYS